MSVVKRILFALFFSITSWPHVYGQTFERKIGLPLTGGLFRDVRGVEVDASGNVFIVDQVSYSLAKLNSNLDGVANLGGYGNGTGQTTNSVWDVAFDASGNIFLAMNKDIYKFNSSNAFVSKFSTTYGGTMPVEVLGIATDASGNVYGTDPQARKILKFNNSGGFLGEIGTTPPNTVNTPAGITISGTTLAITDFDGGVKRYNVSGTFLNSFGAYGAGPGQLNLPWGITTDAAGNYYVADALNYRVQKFSSSGTYMTQFGSSGTEDGKFSFPVGIAVDAGGNIYVTDGRLQKFDAAGNWLLTKKANATADGMFSGLSDVATDSQGNIYVADANNHRIQKFGPDGTFIAKWGTNGTGNGQFAFPSGIAINSDDIIYVVDASNARIQTFNTAGEYQGQFGTFGTGDGQLQGPNHIAIDENKNVFIAQNYGTARVIHKFTSAGIFVMKWGSQGASDEQFQNISDITADGKGNLYIVDSSLERVSKFTTNGVFVRVWTSTGEPGPASSAGYPAGCFIDNNGNVNVANEFETQVFTPDGDLLSKWYPTAPGIGKPTFGKSVIGKNSRLHMINGRTHELHTFVLPSNLSLSRYTASAGETIQVFGAGFNETATSNVVYFGAVKGTVTAATSTQLDVTVPTGATEAPVTVINNGITSTTQKPFRISFPSTGIINGSTFVTKSTFATQYQHADVVTGDLDGDGKADLVFANKGLNGVSIMKNQATGAIVSDASLDASFAAPINISTGNIFGLELADLDGDGKLDIIATNLSQGTISVIRNNSTPGTIAMAGKVDFGGYSFVDQLAVADVTGDGKVDIIAGYNSNFVVVLRNTSTPGSIITSSFVQHQTLDVGYNPGTGSDQIMGLAVADIDMDTRPELVITGTAPNNNSVRIHKNISATETNIWAAPPTLSLDGGTALDGVAVGDLDGNGFPEIVVINSANPGTMSIFQNMDRNNPPYTFAGRVDYATSNFGGAVTIADANGDGRSDILVGNQTFLPTLVNVFTNRVGSDFPLISSSFSRFDVAVGNEGFAVGDLEGDGKADIIGTNHNEQRVYFVRNSLNLPVITSLSAASGTAGTEIAIDGTGFSATPANNAVFFGSAKATVTTASATHLTVTVPFGATYGPVSLTVGGYTTYSKADFKSTFAAPAVIDAHSFAAPFEFTIPNGAKLFEAADFDGDGKADVAVTIPSTNTVSVFRNTATSGAVGNSSFATKVDVNVGSAPILLSSADFDGDGNRDIIVATATSFVVFRNTSTVGTISFASPVAIIQSNISSMTLNDVDSDGKVDVSFTYVNDTPFAIVRNQSIPGSLSFATAVNSTQDAAATSMVVGGDINNDQKPDMLVKMGNALATYTNLSGPGATGASYFQLGIHLSGVGSELNSMTTADMNGDGLRDGVLFTNGFVKVLKSPFTFNTIFLQTAGNTLYGSVGMLDGDDKPDIVGANGSSNSLSVYKNNATPGSMLLESFGRNDVATTAALQEAKIVDIDNDGRKDIVALADVANKLLIFRNQIANPQITNVTPGSGLLGATVTITGSGFSTTPVVKFNGTTATVTSASYTEIVVTIPALATSGPLTVTVGDVTGLAPNDFTVTQPPAPTITSLQPSSGPVGTSVTINGTNFNTTLALNVVKFNGTTATPTSGTATTIVVPVPVGATTGPVTVAIGSATATSASNFTVTVPGGDTSGPVITDNTSASVSAATAATVVASIIDNESTITSVLLEFRSVTGDGIVSSRAMSLSGGSYSATINANEIGDLGVEYKITAVSAGGTTVTSGTSGAEYKLIKISAAAGTSGLTIPYAAHGSLESNYRIVAVPMDLTQKSLSQVFDELGAVDKAKWRMFRYSGGTAGTTQELTASTPIEPGKGYWLIVKSAGTALTAGAGSTVQATMGSPFEISLVAGWNQIGNPYNFNLLWSDVQAANAGLPVLRVYRGDFADGTQLNALEGGFVNVSAAMTLKFPVKKNTSVNSGRKLEEVVKTNPIDGKDWEVGFTIRNGGLTNGISGFGMNEKASNEFDIFDGFNMPEFFTERIELNHDKKKANDFYSKDIIPVAPTGEWTFDVLSTSAERLTTIEWSNDYFGDNDRALVLWDVARQMAIDMREATSYTFDKTESKSFKVYFGPADDMSRRLRVKNLVLHAVSPNPADGRVSISFSTPSDGPVNISVVNLLGQRVFFADQHFSRGYHNVSFDYEGTAVSGVHIIQVNDGTTTRHFRIHLR